MLTIVGAAVLAQVYVWGCLIYLHNSRHVWYGFHDISDIWVYLERAQWMAQGLKPYLDFQFEYPPLAIPLLTLPGHLGDTRAYFWWFSAEMMIASSLAAGATAATAGYLWRGLRRPLIVAAMYAVAVAALGTIVANRYDAVVALVLALFLLCLAKRWWVAAGAVLGLGFALKLTPLILLPLIFVLAPQWRTIWRTSLIFAVCAVTPFLYYLSQTHTVSGLTYIFRYHFQRPMQIESVLAMPMMLGQLRDRTTIVITSSYGSQGIESSAAHALASMSGVLMAIAMTGIYALIWRRRELLRSAPQHVPLAVLALILAFMTFGKVLSPQYFIWILPALALICLENAWLGVLGMAVIGLTQVEFPAGYWGLVNLERHSIIILLVRNWLLVTLFVLTAVRLWALPPTEEPEEV